MENPNIVVTKTVSTGTVTRGGILTYTISFTNSGSGTARFVVVTDAIPAGTEYIVGSAQAISPSANITYSHDFGTSYNLSQGPPVTHIKWSLGSDLAPGTSGSVRFQVQVK